MKSAATPVRLDHVHVGVRDRRRAAAWYRRVLQLRTADDYRRHSDTRGPLVLSGDGNRTHAVADPDGNPVEITTYDHAAVERAMKR